MRCSSGKSKKGKFWLPLSLLSCFCDAVLLSDGFFNASESEHTLSDAFHVQPDFFV